MKKVTFDANEFSSASLTAKTIISPVVDMENKAYWIGPDGIMYVWDGNKMSKVHDKVG